MGVHGLWKLIDPSGKPVPLETLENKVLAIDVSIWLHQVIKGFQDSHGNPLPNAHLLGLFHRVCKLLFYKIKPVFVFDGGVPHLKKQTIASRQQLKSKAELEADKVRQQLLKNLVKHKALKKVLGNASASLDLSVARQRKEPDMFKLPPEKKELETSLSGSEDDVLSSDEEVTTHKSWSTVDIHAIDVNSAQFKSLPPDVRHDILSELKETRKQSSWGRLHEMPKESTDFSSYQMSRLLKRRSIQVSLEDAEKEMGGKSLSLGEIESLLNDQGVCIQSDAGKRIASDNTTRYLYIKGVEKSILSGNKSEGNKSEITSKDDSSSTIKEERNLDEKTMVKQRSQDIKEDFLKDVLEFIPEEDEEFVELSSNSEDESSVVKEKEEVNLKVAQNFIFENSGLTQEQILAVIKYQNAVDNDSQANTEQYLTPDMPSTSGLKGIVRSSQGEHLLSTDSSKEVCSKNIDNFQSSSLISERIENIKDSESKQKDVATAQQLAEDSSGAHIAKHRGIEDGKESNLSTSGSGDVYLINKSSSIEIKDDSIKSSSDELKGDRSETFETKSLNDHKGNGVLSSLNNDVVEQSNSDSDNDSFVEVDSVVQLPSLVSVEPKKALEVVINKDNKPALEDDIFADVFAVDQPKDTIPSKDLKNVINSITPLNRNDTKTTRILKENEIENEQKTNIVNKFSNAIEPGTEKVDLLGKSDKQIDSVDDVDERKNRKAPNFDESILKTPEKKMDSEQAVATTSNVSSEELKKIQASIEAEHRGLMAEQGRQERLASSVTDQMVIEAQELLELFGVPYIVAPMEAEAQCAFLDLISLTDGTITDDSDIWLFGGQKVYKNFFNQKKHVMQFKIEDINHYFKMERQKMILLALLVGSDYTPGIQGVGPVTALEILASFPPSPENILAGLQKFRDWLKSGMSVGPGRTPLKNKLKNVQFTEGFPSLTIVDAYLNPKVDESREAFTWEFPDLDGLRDFAKRKFKWTKMKSDEILVPVMKKLEERKSQRSLDSYFAVIPKLRAAEGKLSKRVQQAVDRMGRTITSGSEDDPDEVEGSTQPKRRCTETPSTKPKSARGGSKRRGHGRGRVKLVEPSITATPAPPEEQAPIHPPEIPGMSGELIPQRAKDKINALKNKLKAIEIYRTSKIDKGIKKQKGVKRKVLKEAKLSESSDSD